MASDHAGGAVNGAGASRLPVLVPVAHHIEPRTQERLGVLVERGYTVRTLRGCSQVDLARSSLASEALRDGFTETFWIDSDIDFDPDDVERVRAWGQPFVAGLYVKKGQPQFAARFRPDFAGMTLGEGGGLLPMDGVGFGFVYVRGDVFHAVAEAAKLPACTGGYNPELPITPYFMPMVVPEGETWHYLSEDLAFCRRATVAGFPPLADTRIRLGHVSGSYTFGWEDLVPKSRFDTLTIGAPEPKEE